MNERHQQYLAHLSERADAAVVRHGLKGVRAEVGFVLDVSKSMYAMYKSNMVAELATRLLALSLEFDDDGVIPAYAFGDRCRHLGDLRVDDFAGWVEREVIRTGSDFQNGCRYAPVIHEVCSYFFPEDWHLPTQEVTVGRIFKKRQTLYPTLSAPRAHPVYALFVTSGDCQDREATTDAVRRSSRLPIFWQFIGLQPGKGSSTRFSFLEKLDTLGNTHVDNCGFFEVSDTRNDALLFEGMVKEFPSYLACPEVDEMLLPAELGGRTTKGDRGHGDELRGMDTAMRLAFDEAGDAGLDAEAAERSRRRKLAEARALDRRTERSQVALRKVEDVEPTSTLSPLVSRTLKAVSHTRTSVPRASAPPPDPIDPSDLPVISEVSAEDARALRLSRRREVEARSPALPEGIEAAQAQLARHVEPTRIRGPEQQADLDAYDADHDAYAYDERGTAEPSYDWSADDVYGDAAGDDGYAAQDVVHEYAAEDDDEELAYDPAAYRPFGQQPAAEHTRTTLVAAAEGTATLRAHDDAARHEATAMFTSAEAEAELQDAEERLRAIRARRASRNQSPP